MKKLLLGVLLLASATGCQPANISAVMRGPDHDYTAMETRCESTDMRVKSEMDRVLEMYDGWRVFYISEYTTGHKFGTDGVICFERPVRRVSR